MLDITGGNVDDLQLAVSDYGQPTAVWKKSNRIMPTASKHRNGPFIGPFMDDFPLAPIPKDGRGRSNHGKRFVVGRK
jgi:hypothetical protein